MIALIGLLPVLTSCPVGSPLPSGAQRYTYAVVAEFPHDPDAFTQGLVIRDGQLFEGTGLNGESSLRRVNFQSGAVLQQTDLEFQFFGEGIDVVGNRIVQLTWLSGVAFEYDRDSFELTGQFNYDTEGWGLTNDGERFIMSDGTATLYFRDLETFNLLGQITVRDAMDRPRNRLNELEFIDGEVFANVFQEDFIVRINPNTGLITGTVDLTGLAPAEVAGSLNDVLNGVAFDSATGKLYVTGKRWPTLFEIQLIPVEE